jgi:hypothetical protein
MLGIIYIIQYITPLLLGRLVFLKNTLFEFDITWFFDIMEMTLLLLFLVNSALSLTRHLRYGSHRTPTD